MIRSVTFIEPKNDHLHIFSRYELPRLGSILLATILKRRGYKTEVLFMKSRDVLRRKMDPDLVAISAITPTAESAYRIADAFRAKGTPVVFGGPHVTFLPQEALEHGDYCVIGEGEAAMPALVEALNGQRPLSDVPGLAWKENGVMRTNPAAPPVENLDELPFPDFSLLDMGGRTKMGSLGPSRAIVPMQTSRGCPFDCSFCSVTEMFGRRYRYRSTQNILSELSQYDPKRHYIFFYDDNFAANPRRTKELLREMIARNLGFTWSTQVRADVARDPEMLDLFAKAGCTTLYIGFESVDPESLKEMKKGQTTEEIGAAIAAIRARKIHIHGMFVFGFDSDTPQKARATIKFAIKEKIDSAQFLILTPLPGTPTYFKLTDEQRILDRAWDTYDAHHVKFQPIGFSPWELQRMQIEAHSRFYSPFQIIRKLLRGKLLGFFIGIYGNHLNKRWQRDERRYLAVLREAQSALQTVVPRNVSAPV